MRDLSIGRHTHKEIMNQVGRPRNSLNRTIVLHSKKKHSIS